MPQILDFSPEQQAQVWAERAAYNSSAESLDRQRSMVGNSIAITADAWRRIDARATQVARSRLAVYAALAAASSTPVSMGDIVSFYPQISGNSEVLVTMDGQNQAKADAAVVSYVGTPIPILTSSVKLGWRQMEVLRKGPGGLDLASIASAQRIVAEKLEDMVINGLSSVNVGGSTVYGLRSLPQRNTYTHGLTLATSTGAQWLTAVKSAVTALLGDNQFGRVTLFINIGDYTAADTTDYAANYSGTILQRLRAMSQIADIIPASTVPANEILGIADLQGGEWGSILSAMPMTTRSAVRANPEDPYLFSVLAAGAPQFRVDYNGNAPFVHGTTA